MNLGDSFWPSSEQKPALRLERYVTRDGMPEEHSQRLIIVILDYLGTQQQQRLWESHNPSWSVRIPVVVPTSSV